MGSQTILDLIASTIVFGSLLIIMLRINASNSSNMQRFRGDLTVQENLVAVVSLLEYDFRRIGYCFKPENFPNPALGILWATTDSVRFVTDLPYNDGFGTLHQEGDGILDTVTYKIGPTSEASFTQNPNDRLLYRIVKGDPNTNVGVDLGVTRFELTYFLSPDNGGAVLPSPVPIAKLSAIDRIQITLECQSLFANAIDTTQIGGLDSQVGFQQYQTAFWKQIRLVARNLRNR
jgi:hypothetical protein